MRNTSIGADHKSGRRREKPVIFIGTESNDVLKEASEYFEKFKSFISDPLSARRTYIAIHCPLISLALFYPPIWCHVMVLSSASPYTSESRH